MFQRPSFGLNAARIDYFSIGGKAQNWASSRNLAGQFFPNFGWAKYYGWAILTGLKAGSSIGPAKNLAQP